MIVDVTCRVPVCGLEPFRSMPTGPPPLKPGAAAQAVRLPGSSRPHRRSSPAGARSTGTSWRPGRWPTTSASGGGARCTPRSSPIMPGEHCQRMRRDGPQAPRSSRTSRPARSWRSPESAVVDTGLRTVVFVETMPGMFDGVEVVLGPRCGDSYPVIKGLEAGQRVAVAGAFLLDAETRLNPSLASSYFGASGRAQPLVGSRSRSRLAAARRPRALAKLEPGDRRIAERQKICPVTRKALGSMGTPDARGRRRSGRLPLLRAAARTRSRRNPQRYLAELAARTSAHDRRDHHLLDPPPRPGDRRLRRPGRPRASGPPGTRRWTRSPTCPRTRSSSSPTGRATARARSRTRSPIRWRSGCRGSAACAWCGPRATSASR